MSRRRPEVRNCKSGHAANLQSASAANVGHSPAPPWPPPPIGTPKKPRRTRVRNGIPPQNPRSWSANLGLAGLAMGDRHHRHPMASYPTPMHVRQTRHPPQRSRRSWSPSSREKTCGPAFVGDAAPTSMLKYTVRAARAPPVPAPSSAAPARLMARACARATPLEPQTATGWAHPGPTSRHSRERATFGGISGRATDAWACDRERARHATRCMRACLHANKHADITRPFA